MAISFPVSLDALTNPAPTDLVAVVSHSGQHSDVNDAIEAIEAKLGIDSSAVITSIDYLLKNASSVNPGHKHTAAAITDFSAAADARIAAAAGVSVASLSGGKVPTSQLPALALTDVFVVASQAAQLALTAEEGDVAVRTDLNKSYIHNGGVAGTMADWQELLTPTDAVTSVNGATGVVVLTTTNIAEGTGLYFTDERAQDAIGVMVNATLSYVDATPALGINLGNANSWTATQTFSGVDINGGSIDGTAIGAASASTGIFTQADIDNLRLDGNTLSSTNAAGPINIKPDTTGLVNIGASATAVWEFGSTGIAVPRGGATYQILSNTAAFQSLSSPNAGLFFSTGGNRFNFRDTSGTEIWTAYLTNAIDHLYGISAPWTTPAQVTANQNDYAGFGQAMNCGLDTDAARTFTGFVAPTGSRGKHRYVTYVGTNSAIISHLDAASAAANQSQNTSGANFTLTAGQSMLQVYHTPSSKWLSTKLA